MRRRGVPDEIATRLLAERAELSESAPGEPEVTGAEERAARSAAAKVRLRGGDVRAEVQRVAQALARRGFPSGLSWRIARERLSEVGAGADLVEPTDEA